MSSAVNVVPFSLSPTTCPSALQSKRDSERSALLFVSNSISLCLAIQLRLPILVKPQLRENNLGRIDTVIFCRWGPNGGETWQFLFCMCEGSWTCGGGSFSMENFSVDEKEKDRVWPERELSVFFSFLFFLLASLGFLSPLSLYSSASIFSFVLALFFFVCPLFFSFFHLLFLFFRSAEAEYT